MAGGMKKRHETVGFDIPILTRDEPWVAVLRETFLFLIVVVLFFALTAVDR